MRRDERTPRLYRGLHVIVQPIVNALYRPATEGLEHIPRRGPAILASNHLSFLDSVFLPTALERPIYFLGKSDYFSGWRRWFFEGVGVMPVARQGGDAGEASLRKGQEILEAGHLLGIYPEGTRSPDGRLYRGKTGPVRLAFRTGAPIIPVAMIGTFDVLPPEAAIPRIRSVGIRCGRPLDLSRYGKVEDQSSSEAVLGEFEDQSSSEAGLGEAQDRFVLRSATDELMYELMLLSGQAYVDEYAAKVKSGEVSIGSGDLEELGGALDLRQAS